MTKSLTHSAFLVLGALLAAIAFSLLGVLGFGPGHNSGSGTTGDDSPINPRGSSNALIAYSEWTKTAIQDPNVWEYQQQSSKSNAWIYLYGVQPINNPPWGDRVRPILNLGSHNWRIKVWDRNRNAQAGDGKGWNAYWICSNPHDYSSKDPCGDPKGRIPWFSRSYTTYFYIPSVFTGGPPDMTTPEDHRYVLLLHDTSNDPVPTAATPSPGKVIKCDHIGYIDITIGKETGRYECVNGMCDLTIGGPQR